MSAAAVIVGFVGAAALGGVTRWLLTRGGWRRFPTQTLAVNVAGSLLMGAASNLEGAGRTILVTAGVGSLTTFSSFALDVVRLVDDRRYQPAVLLVALTTVACVAALLVGRAFTST